VERDFSATAPDRLWVADLTYLRCWEGVVFFAFILDAFSRRIVGWQFAAHMRTTLVLDALRMALAQRGPGADVELVHHSDAGSQPGLNRSSQQCLEHERIDRTGRAVRCRSECVQGNARLSARRLARRAGRSGESRARPGQGPGPGCGRVRSWRSGVG
jgi:transposase InsO family protein